MNGKENQPVFEREIKGLDMVRRDWSNVAKKCSEFALDTILSGKPKEDIFSAIVDYLCDVNKNLEVNWRFLIIFRQNSSLAILSLLSN